MDSRIDYDNPDWNLIVLKLRKFKTLSELAKILDYTGIDKMSQCTGNQPSYRTGRKILKLYEKYCGGENERP